MYIVDIYCTMWCVHGEEVAGHRCLKDVWAVDYQQLVQLSVQRVVQFDLKFLLVQLTFAECSFHFANTSDPTYCPVALSSLY